MARLQFEMGQTLKPWAALTRSFIALDQAVVLVNAAAHANVDVKKNNAKDGAGRPIKAAAVEAGVHTSKTAADVQKELEQTSEAQSLSTKLQAAYTDSLTHLASVHIHEFNNHQAVLLLKIALEGYRKMGVLGKHGEASVWTMQAHVALRMPALVGSARTVQSGVPGVHSINCTHAVWMALRMGHIAPAQAQSQVVALGVDHHTRRRCHAGCAQEDQPHARMGEPEALRRCGRALRAASRRRWSRPSRARSASPCRLSCFCGRGRSGASRPSTRGPRRRPAPPS